MKPFLSLYSPKLPLYFVFMLQQVEYDPSKFTEWILRIFLERRSFSSVSLRQGIVMTNRSRPLIASSYIFCFIVVSFPLIIVGDFRLLVIYIILIMAILPLLLCLFLWTIVKIGYLLIILPSQRKLTAEASVILRDHGALKIAVLGSYGKTTMKELLATVLGEGMDVAATPGNKNVSVSHAKFAKKLTGHEQVIIVEFGEGEPGDIERMAKMLQPDIAVVTGLAPNHLDEYSSLEAIAEDILIIENFVKSENVFYNDESSLLRPFIPKKSSRYNSSATKGWNTSEIKISVESTSFKLVKEDTELNLKSGLVGLHQVGPISVVAVLANKVGISTSTIEVGVAKTAPFEHRMQPRYVNGAWLIDDTYNGNLEGVIAGLEFLKSINSQRRWYVTPGLVDQGDEKERVHLALGKKIAEVNPDIVVLMKNSVTRIIEDAMEDNGFRGELRIEKNPLDFYLNVEHHVASGDIVLMQNDWTDNYN